MTTALPIIKPDPDYWQTYGIIINGQSLYNLRVQFYPIIINELGQPIGQAG